MPKLILKLHNMYSPSDVPCQVPIYMLFTRVMLSVSSLLFCTLRWKQFGDISNNI